MSPDATVKTVLTALEYSRYVAYQAVACDAYWLLRAIDDGALERPDYEGTISDLRKSLTALHSIPPPRQIETGGG